MARTMTVRTRFAPSPTGYLHIGGVRTALFNWLLARRHGGQFILRIDDTDQSRHVEEAVERIVHGLRWVGLDWDEGPGVGGPYAPYFQSQRLETYERALMALLESGWAYPDRTDPAEIQMARQAAGEAKQSFVYRGTDREMPAREAAAIFRDERPAVRFKVPPGETTTLDDLVRGRVNWQTDLLGDFTIARAGGAPLYNFVSIVDDIEMKITHVVRAEEHLSNTHPQLLIARGLGTPPPLFAHLPYVAEPGSKNKLSKRKLEAYLKIADFAKLNERGQAIAAAIGLKTSAETFNPVIVDFYEQVGFLPDAIINYLALLGWSLDDKTEFFTRDELAANFSLERVNKAPASFDSKKLWAFQEHYVRQIAPKRKAALVLPFLQKAGLVSTPPPCDVGPKLTDLLQAAGDRIKLLGDILDYTDFFVPDDHLPYHESAFDKRLRQPPEAAPLLREFRDRLAATTSFTAADLEKSLHAFLLANQIKPEKIIHALRVAVTGKSVGCGLFETLAILGRDRCLARIDRALARLESPSTTIL
jgi:glutamyl-tRNA synthetase